VRRELSIVPAQAYITETYRVNYCCGGCVEDADNSYIIKPDVPEPVIKRGLASPSAAAHVMYQKYVNALPLYRQSKDWSMFGVDISRVTLANWIIYTSTRWLLPLWNSFKALLLLSPIILADETTFQVLKEPGKTPQSKSQMWVYCTGKWSNAPPIVLFEYQPSRAGAHPEAFLRDAENYFLLTDGYIGYSSVSNATLCNCWQHMRRYFTEAMPKNAPKDNPARIGLEYCQKLFALERGYEDLSAEKRLEQRIEKSKPVADAFFDWVASVDPLAGSKFGKAIVYATNQRIGLSMFLTDGRIELSTNRIENLIRPVALGRKNYLFADTVNGARSSAIAYSIIQTAIMNGLNPYQYLLHLFTELPTVLTKNPNADLSRYFPWTDYVQMKCKYAQGAEGQLTIDAIEVH
jgi:transposase